MKETEKDKPTVPEDIQIMEQNIEALTRAQDAIEEAVCFGKVAQNIHMENESGDALIMNYLSFLDTVRVRTQHMQDYYTSLLYVNHQRLQERIMMNALYAPPEIFEKIVIERSLGTTDSEDDTEEPDGKTVYPDSYKEV